MLNNTLYSCLYKKVKARTLLQLTVPRFQELRQINKTHWGQSFAKCVTRCLWLWHTNCRAMTATVEGLCRAWSGNTDYTSSTCWSHLPPWTWTCHTSSTPTKSWHGGKTSSWGGEEGCRHGGRRILLYASTRRHGPITLKQMAQE
jgi:hypothetical protein